MTSKPVVLVLSTNSTKPKSLIKLITKSSTVNQESSSIVEHDLALDTKYYTAEIKFVGIEEDFERTEEFNAKVEGVIIHLDANKETGLEDLETWQNIQNDCDVEVKILIANYCNDETKITRTKAIEWCIKRSFEFVELYPAKNNEESETDFVEKVGVDRIIEALHSHTWSNLKLKSQTKKVVKKDQIEGNKTEEINRDEFREDELDEFTELFTQLHTMRESLSSLPMNQRKQCAEQMVTAFWKAIGGEEEELLDL